MKKLLLVAAVAVAAYVIGAKDGRERLSRLQKSVRRMKKDQVLGHAVDSAADKVEARATDFVDRVADVGRDAAQRLTDKVADVTERAVD